MNTSPDEAYSRFPTGYTRDGNPRNKFFSVFRPSGSASVDITSGGLFSNKYTRRSSASTVRPATSTRSFPASAFVPSSVTTRPFTRTCPLRINCSACLREAIPALAIIFCNLSCMVLFATRPQARHSERSLRSEESLLNSSYVVQLKFFFTRLQLPLRPSAALHRVRPQACLHWSRTLLLQSTLCPHPSLPAAANSPMYLRSSRSSFLLPSASHS